MILKVYWRVFFWGSIVVNVLEVNHTIIAFSTKAPNVKIPHRFI